MLSLSDFVHLYHAYASVLKFCAQIIKTETLTLEKSPNPAQTLTLRSKKEAMGLPERRGGRCRRHGNPDGERTLGTWSRAASQPRTGGTDPSSAP